jgi:signal transduction histidine kinase
LLAIPDERLPRTVETAAYFVIAEALTNVAKYAQARSVTVKVVQENGDAVVEVSDDGVGRLIATLPSDRNASRAASMSPAGVWRALVPRQRTGRSSCE